MAYDTIPGVTGAADIIVRTGKAITLTPVANASVGKGIVVADGVITAGGTVAGTGVQFQNANSRVAAIICNESNKSIWAKIITSAVVDTLQVADRLVEVVPGAYVGIGPFNSYYQNTGDDESTPAVTRTNLIQIEFASEIEAISAVAISDITEGATTTLAVADTGDLEAGDFVLIAGVTGTGNAALNGIKKVLTVTPDTSIVVDADTDALTLSGGTITAAIGPAELMVGAITIPNS